MDFYADLLWFVLSVCVFVWLLQYSAVKQMTECSMAITEGKV